MFTFITFIFFYVFQALFHFLRENQKDALHHLNLYYPRTGLKHKALDKKLATRLNKAQQDFRKFFLSLIANAKFRQKYFDKEYDQEFGQNFQERLQRLMQGFLGKIEEKLPETEIQQVKEYAETDNTTELHKRNKFMFNKCCLCFVCS